MPAKHDDLFDGIANFQALREAFRRAIKGKRKKPGAAAFTARQETELLRLEHELRSGAYRPGRYTTIELFDPKHRIVSAAPFRDRVVHHALCAVVEPLFSHGFIANSFANRAGDDTGTCYDVHISIDCAILRLRTTATPGFCVARSSARLC